MAKQKSFDFETVSTEEAEQELTQLRSGRSGLTSKYAPLLPVVSDLEEGQAAKLTVEKKEVGPLRGYIYRHLGKETYDIRSVRVEQGKDDYLVVITHSKEEEE